jgi:hypothetical protein
MPAFAGGTLQPLCAALARHAALTTRADDTRLAALTALAAWTESAAFAAQTLQAHLALTTDGSDRASLAA